MAYYHDAQLENTGNNNNIEVLYSARIYQGTQGAEYIQTFRKSYRMLYTCTSIQKCRIAQVKTGSHENFYTFYIYPINKTHPSCKQKKSRKWWRRAEHFPNSFTLFIQFICHTFDLAILLKTFFSPNSGPGNGLQFSSQELSSNAPAPGLVVIICPFRITGYYMNLAHTVSRISEFVVVKFLEMGGAGSIKSMQT